MTRHMDNAGQPDSKVIDYRPAMLHWHRQQGHKPLCQYGGRDDLKEREKERGNNRLFKGERERERERESGNNRLFKRASSVWDSRTTDPPWHLLSDARTFLSTSGSKRPDRQPFRRPAELLNPHWPHSRVRFSLWEMSLFFERFNDWNMKYPCN